jgi:N-acetylglucosaminyldiphosphoundecaprenol N-acetyl-beta-D-mannosaminyltransferase
MIDYGKRDVLGVNVDATDINTAVERIAYFARLRRPYLVTALAVHGLVEATRNPVLHDELADFDLVLPDGQPVRWALNLLHGLDLAEKVPGPTVVDRLLEIAADDGLRVYFYGSTPETLAAIDVELSARFGGKLDVVSTPSKFRPVDAAELDGIIDDINASGANICFVGLGCPRQELFVGVAGHRLEMPSLAVGAAFDYIAGNIDRAPELMQRAGLEWLYRTAQEPRRLASRYLDTNSRFMAGVGRQYANKLARRSPEPAEDRLSAIDRTALIDA